MQDWQGNRVVPSMHPLWSTPAINIYGNFQLHNSVALLIAIMPVKNGRTRQRRTGSWVHSTRKDY